MIDAALRRGIAPPLDAVGRRLCGIGVRPEWVTALGWGIGVGACVAVGMRQWPIALVLWLANRLLDGLDGPVARAVAPTARGGFLDIVADFSVYGGFVLGVAIGVPSARLACVALLLSYYASGTAFLALSSLADRRGFSDEQRSLCFVGGLAEGAETIVVYVLLCLLPADAATIAWAFAVAVAITAGQRVRLGASLLGETAAELPDGTRESRRLVVRRTVTRRVVVQRIVMRRRGMPMPVPVQPAATTAASSSRRSETPGR